MESSQAESKLSIEEEPILKIQSNKYESQDEDEELFGPHHVGWRKESESDEDMNVEEIIRKAIEDEETKTIENASQNLKQLEETTSKRSSNYQIVKHITKLKIMRQLNNLLSLPKEQKKKRGIVNSKIFQQLSKSYHIAEKTISSWYDDLKEKPEILDKLEDLCKTDLGSGQRGHVLKRQNSQLSYPPHIERILTDWIFACQDIGVLVTNKMIQKRALTLVSPYNKEFKASYNWLRKFLSRQGLSLRHPTTKMKKNKEEENRLREAFILQVNRIIEEYRIEHDNIFNVDETPMYWEFSVGI